jgi:hypothetical protein
MPSMVPENARGGWLPLAAGGWLGAAAVGAGAVAGENVGGAMPIIVPFKLLGRTGAAAGGPTGGAGGSDGFSTSVPPSA